MIECGLATNPAALKDNLKHLLPDHNHKVKHRESLPRVPPEHLKTGRIHGRVCRRPITPSMRAVLTALGRRHPNHSRDDLIFPSDMGGEIHESTLGNFVRETMRWQMKITAHGFRTTLNDWRRANGYSEEFFDVQVDHLPKGKVRQAYTQDDLLPERKKMMEKYDAYASRPEPPAGNNIIKMRMAKS